MKKSIAFIALLTAAVMLFAGCSAPTMGPAKYDKNDLETGTYGILSASFETTNWDFTDVGGFNVLYSEDAPDYDKDIVPAINVSIGQAVPMMSEQMLDTLEETLVEMELSEGMEIIGYERVRIDGKSAFMIEQSTILTENMVEGLIESGSLTDDMLEEAGGKEAYIGKGSQQMQIYIVIDQVLLMFTASYDTEGVYRDATINQMLTMIETASIDR